MERKIKTIYLLSGGLRCLDKVAMDTSSSKYEYTLAESLSNYMDIKILTTALDVGQKITKGNIELIGVKKGNTNCFFENLYYIKALKECKKENSVIIFWGYDFLKIISLLYFKICKKFKIIAFEYDSHKPFTSVLPVFKRGFFNLYYNLGRFFLRFFNGYIFFQNRAIKSFRVSEAKSLVIKPGAEVREPVLSDKKHTEFAVTYCGTLSYLNATDVLIETIKLFKNTQIQFLICGSGPFEKEMEKLAQNENISFFGMLTEREITEIYKRSDLLLNLRRTDDEAMNYAFPSKTFEYTATGIPMISTAVLNDKEFIDNVYILDSINPNRLYDLINEVITNYCLAKKKAYNVKTYIEEKYSMASFAKEISDFVNKI